MEHLLLPDGVRVWLSADHHFGHTRNLELSHRPYSAVKQMNQDFIRRHNDVVNHDDIFVAAGDLCMGDFDTSLDAAAELNGQKYLMPGNHDRVSAARRYKPAYVERFRARYEDAGFTVLPESGVTMHVGGHLVAVSHYPYSGDHTAVDRHHLLRPVDSGLPLLHGHIHELRRVEGRMLNVGVDVNNFTPVSQEQVVAFVESAS